MNGGFVLNFRKLQYFAAVAKAGSFAAASRQINISQPALSTRIKELEEELGVELFVRAHLGVTITMAGMELLVYCTEIFNQLDSAKDAMAKFRDSPIRHFTLGMTPTPGKVLLQDLLALCNVDPGLTLTIREGLSVELFEQARSNRVDMALCYDPPSIEDMATVPLYQEDLYLVGPPHFFEGHGDEIAFSEVSGLPLVLDGVLQSTRILIEQEAEKTNIKLNVKLEIEPTNLKRDILVANDMCTIVPYGLFVGELDSYALSCAHIIAPRLTRTLNLVARPKLANDDFIYIQKILRMIIAKKIIDKNWAWQPVS